MQSLKDGDSDAQANFIEAREPTELILCVILAAAYAGLAKYCWRLLETTHNWRLFLSIEGFFITISLLSLVLGLRPYISPSSLQIGKKGIKYRGPYWPQRKTVNWEQIFRLYVSPELILVLYHPWKQNKGVWPLLIQTLYLSDREQIVTALACFCPIEPVLLSSPSWQSRFTLLVLFVILLVYFLEALLG